MPFKDKTRRRAASANAMRRLRLYKRAVAAGHPLAVAAERARNPMGPINALEARLMPMTKAEREPYRAEHKRLLAECQAAACEGKRQERYLALREQALAAIEVEGLHPAGLTTLGASHEPS